MSFEALKNLPPWKPGETLIKAVTSGRLNTLLTSLLEVWQGHNIAAGYGVQVSKGKQVTISISPDFEAGAAAAHPFRVTVAGGAAQLRFGTVNNLVPTYSAVAIGQTTAIPLSGATYIWIDVEVDTAGAIVAVTIGSGAALPATPTDASHGFCLIAIVQADFTVLQSLNRSVWHQLFYRSHIFF